MILKVVPLPAQQGIKFDLILPDYFVVTLAMDDYELRAYGSVSMTEAIELRVLQWLRDNNYNEDGISILFC